MFLNYDTLWEVVWEANDQPCVEGTGLHSPLTVAVMMGPWSESMWDNNLDIFASKHCKYSAISLDKIADAATILNK